MAAAACCEESVDRARREHKKSSGKVARLPLPVVALPVIESVGDTPT